MLNTGPDDHRNPSDMAEFEDVLEDCARHRLPMICANPDLEVIRGGVRVLCAGSLAVRYQELGGDVRSLGKPDPAIYQPVLERARACRRTGCWRWATRCAPTLPARRGWIWPPAGCWTASTARPCGAGDGGSTPRRRSGGGEAGLAPVATLPRFAW